MDLRPHQQPLGHCEAPSGARDTGAEYPRADGLGRRDQELGGGARGVGYDGWGEAVDGVETGGDLAGDQPDLELDQGQGRCDGGGGHQVGVDSDHGGV